MPFVVVLYSGMYTRPWHLDTNTMDGYHGELEIPMLLWKRRFLLSSTSHNHYVITTTGMLD